MKFSPIKTDQYCLSILCADKKRIYVRYDKDYLRRLKYTKWLRRNHLKLITYSDGRFRIVDYQSKLTNKISLNQIGAIINRFMVYKNHHTQKELHNNLNQLIQKVLAETK